MLSDVRNIDALLYMTLSCYLEEEDVKAIVFRSVGQKLNTRLVAQWWLHDLCQEEVRNRQDLGVTTGIHT